MRLYVIRHSMPVTAKSEMFDDVDLDADLTPEGEDIAHALAEWMADKDEVPSMIWASPAVRAQQTAQILRDDLGLPGIVTDVGVGPGMSIRQLVLSFTSDATIMRPCIVSHHESIENGLRELRRRGDGRERETSPHLDQLSMCEMRILKIKRKTGNWVEHRRILPSDLGLWDHYE